MSEFHQLRQLLAEVSGAMPLETRRRHPGAADPIRVQADRMMLEDLNGELAPANNNSAGLDRIAAHTGELRRRFSVTDGELTVTPPGKQRTKWSFVLRPSASTIARLQQHRDVALCVRHGDHIWYIGRPDDEGDLAWDMSDNGRLQEALYGGGPEIQFIPTPIVD
jgi:hypothetical protein